jgi:hypothetical protein
LKKMVGASVVREQGTSTFNIFSSKTELTNRRVTIEYCAMEKMLANYFTKRLQGELFAQARDIIMNTQDNVTALDATLTGMPAFHRSVLD